jgi:hypothetical protein
MRTSGVRYGDVKAIPDAPDAPDVRNGPAA